MAQKIVFIGSSDLGLECLLLSEFFAVQEVLCLTQRLTARLQNIAVASGLPVKHFSGTSDFRPLIESHQTSMPFFIYQLDMLVPGDLTERYAFYNLHRGDLHTNRGPTPDVWPILNGDTQTSLSLHKINDKVDAGILIDTYDVLIADNDDTVSLKHKLEAGLPEMIVSLHEYLRGLRTGYPLRDGSYRPWIIEADFTLDLAVDSLEVVDRKIRSQRAYNGAILLHNGGRYYVTGILAVKPLDASNFTPFKAENGVIQVCSGKHRLTLQWNESPKYPRPPIRPPSKRI